MNKNCSFRIFSALAMLLVLGSCAMNGIFLHPYTLHENDRFSEYVEEKKDTLTLCFDETCQPSIIDSKKNRVELPYAMESRFFPNRVGDSINAWLFSPLENYNGVTIYFLHGNAGNIVYQYAFVTPFVKRGFQVFMIDYSGFGFSEGNATREAVYIDATDGLQYLLNDSGIRYDHLLIYGQSLGGHLSTVIANENQDKIDGLIIEGAFSSHKDVASDRVPVLGRIFTKEMYSGEKNIVGLKKPVLIIHSIEDETIKFKHGERLYSLANEPKEFYQIDKPHIYGPLYYADSIVSKMNKLIER